MNNYENFGVKMNKKTILTSIFILTAMFPSLSLAEVGRKAPSADGLISAGPYYNPATKSYFELRRMQDVPGKQTRWFGAKDLAEKLVFKGTQGRLATVKNLETHQFIMRNFKASNYWIGLQYFCGSQSLKWVDGTDAEQSGFSAWDTQWSNTDIRCDNMNYMPVHYTTHTATKALRWRASGPNKGYVLYLVEYPTGKE